MRSLPIFLLFIALCIGPAAGAALLPFSDALCKALPPDYLPADRQRPTALETRLLLANVGVTFEADGFEEELDRICSRMEHSMDSLKDKREQAKSAYAVAIYWYNNSKDYPRVLAAQQKALDYTVYDTATWTIKLSLLAMKGNVHLVRNEMPEAIDIINHALELLPGETNKKINFATPYLYLTLANAYAALELQNDVIGYTRKARLYCDADPRRSTHILAIANLVAAEAYSQLFRKTHNTRYQDSATRLVQEVRQRCSNAPQWRTTVYGILGRIAFWNGDFKLALNYLDTATDKNNIEEDDMSQAEVMVVYHALAKLWLEKTPLKRLRIRENFLNDSVIRQAGVPDIYYIYEDLFKEAYNKSEWEAALGYLVKSSRHKDSVELLKQRVVYYNLEARYENGKREALIDRLHNDKKIASKQNKIILLTAVVIILTLTLSIIALVAINRLKQKKQGERQRQLELENIEIAKVMLLQETKLLDDQLKALQAQRTHISEDMHNELGSALVALKFYVSDMKQSVADEASKRVFCNVEEEINGIYKHARNYIHALNQSSPDIRYDIDQSLQLLAAQFNKRKAVQLLLDVDAGKLELLPVVQNNELYFILKETIANALKHAHADTIFIQVGFTAGECRFSVSDNGSGFDPLAGKAGMGLANIKRRARQMGGRIVVRTGPKGTLISGSFALLNMDYSA
ncbi:sensor histidine kinase [Taibaiella chishuiensis]|uniref:histidine kinase n=1 Tax=Taibaiella chishuiensis TaxID=1434707 RepID=A0A2P8D8K8_9BACT|nr:ATP-binding protein [Taibaiella chishuiensis]PSK93554.1 signal transduction histidine kinase [Taibaiella chishuiensis]